MNKLKYPMTSEKPVKFVIQKRMSLRLGVKIIKITLNTSTFLSLSPSAG
jgi:hypothetical protein